MFNFLSTIEANCDSIFTPEALELIREVLGYFRNTYTVVGRGKYIGGFLNIKCSVVTTIKC